MLSKLPPRERQVVDVLYQQGPMSVAEVCDALPVAKNQIRRVFKLFERPDGNRRFAKRQQSRNVRKLYRHDRFRRFDQFKTGKFKNDDDGAARVGFQIVAEINSRNGFDRFFESVFFNYLVSELLLQLDRLLRRKIPFVKRRDFHI